MTDNNELNRIKSKIKKLFALAANDAALGNETTTALRQANALLEKYAIKKCELHEEDVVFANFKDYPIGATWVKSLCGVISRFYNCRVIFDYNWDRPKTIIIGTEGNRTTAIIVIEQLMDQIKKETVGKGAEFKNGAVVGLHEVCQKMKEDRESDITEVIPGTGLMVLDINTQQKKAVDNFVNANYSHLKSSRGGRASAEGAAYGRTLNPGARLGGGQKRLGN